MSDHSLTRLTVIASAALAGLLSGWLLTESSVSVVALGTALLAMLVGTVIVPSISSGNRFSLTIAAAAALPFIFISGERVDVVGVLGVYLAAAAVLVITDWTRSGDLNMAGVNSLRGLLGQIAFVGIFAQVRDLLGSSLGTSGWEILVPFLSGALAWFGVELGMWSGFTARHRRVSARYLALAGLKDANVFVSLVATGGLFGLMYEALGWWALPVALLPYSFAHGAFRRFQETKSTYRQTIRALARIPEAAGLNLDGHADRTSEMAVSMAKELGLSPEEVEDVEFAALMHDIGRITLNEPTVVEQGWTDDDLARWGSEIIAGAPSLARVASYVRSQYEPFRKPGEESDRLVNTAARIVKIASAYDARMGEGMSSLESLEQLHQGAAYEYDPEVVASLRRVLDAPSRVTV